MAGVTNWPFRSLCHRFGAALYVSEMITARPLVEGHGKTLRLASFGPDEKPRSLQLYGIDPGYVGEAVARLVGEGQVDHIDLNFGCPVRKVTRLGGGAAIPAKPRLLRRIVRSAVSRAGAVPVTIKFRVGIDDDHPTFLEAGRIGQEEGCAAVAMHARTAAQLYDGEARWEAIATLKSSLTHVPVFFRDLADVFDGREPEPPPKLGGVAEVMREHAELLARWVGERHAMRMFRKHATWYTKGFRGSARLRTKLVAVRTLAELEEVLAGIDADAPLSPEAVRVSRGKSAGRQRVVLPEGWLDDPEDATPPCAAAEDPASGG
jgi:tRNA-dihydrouridine synthase